MSNPFGDDDNDNEILEGFLCPICKTDFKKPNKLKAHVDQEHSEEQVLKSFSGILSMAKKKILNLDEKTNDFMFSFDQSVRNNFSNNMKLVNPIFLPQDVGTDCNHISQFKVEREKCLVRYSSESNKLIIRLHKLLTDRPTDPFQRKQHEQQLVPWLDGKLVKLCPSCAKSFGLTRRQHHCRLCGSIMCTDCSFYLEINDAISIVNPSLLSPTMMKSIDDKDKEANSLRVCEHCLHLLEIRKEMQDSRIDRPQITRLYEKIVDIKKKIDPDIPMYSKIVNSLYGGDSIYRLSDASELREKIGKSAENIDNISKIILSIPFEHGSREEALKKAIRLSCISYIKEQMLSIPQLPLEEEIKRLQIQRSRETLKRIELERRQAMEAFERCELADSNTGSSGSSASAAESSHSRSGTALSTMDNWSSYQTSTNLPLNTDVLVEQISIIKGYIKQAKEAMRFEEVAILESNLNELTMEFYKRQLQ